MNDTIEIHEEKDSGFTLIELLIVIVILGILATVTVFAVGGITDRGSKSACSADLKTLEVAIESFRAQSPTGAYPANTAALVGATGFLRSAPTYFQTTGGGTITKTASGATSCTDTQFDSYASP